MIPEFFNNDEKATTEAINEFEENQNRIKFEIAMDWEEKVV